MNATQRAAAMQTIPFRSAALLFAGAVAIAGCESPVDPAVPTTGTTPVAAVATALGFNSLPDTTGGLRIANSDSVGGAAVVRLQTITGARVATANVVVRASLVDAAGNPWVGASIVGADSALTDAQGEARFSGVIIKGLVGTGRVRFSSGSLTPVSLPLRIVAGAVSAANSAVSLSPDTIPVGGVAQVVATLLDNSGNKIGAGQTVTAALSGGNAAATLSAVAFVATDSTYRATVTGATAGTPLTLTLTANGVALSATRSLSVKPAVVPVDPATQIALTVLPGDTTGGGTTIRSGSAMPAVVVALRSASNAAVAQAGVPITATLVTATGGAVTSSTLTGAGPVSTSADGTASFPAPVVSGTVGVMRLRFSAPGLTPASIPLRLTPGAPSASASAVTLAPDTVPVGTATKITVLPRDAQNNKVGPGQTIAATLTGGTSAGTLSAFAFQSGDSSYIATFNGSTVGTPLTVRAAATGISIAQTRTVRVTAGPVSTAASSIVVSSDSVAVGSGTVIVVTPRDAAGNKKGAGLTVNVTATGGTSGGTLSAVRYTAADSSYRSTFTAQVVGTPLTVQAAVAGAPIVPTDTVVVKPAPPQAFTFCSSTGAVCEFVGLRDVRLVSTTGATFTQEFYAEVPCAPTGYARGFTVAPTNLSYTKCEYGDLKTEVLDNPNPGLAGLTAVSVTVPRGSTGSSTIDVAGGAGTPNPAGQDEGDFRMVCGFVKMGFFDPLVYPGQENSSHLHMFFGNVDINPNSTSATLTNSGSSTCQGGTVNRTGYWVPALFDSRTSEIIPPNVATIYYKTGYTVVPSTVQDIPAGLVMIAGNKNATTGPQLDPNGASVITQWFCQNTTSTNTGAVPSCPVGDNVVLIISFPQCWDGVNLDSPDHKSHMAYPIWRNPPQHSSCPSTHPVMLPHIEEIFKWKVQTGMNSNYWRLTSDTYSTSIRGGYSAHADWMYGWNPTWHNTMVSNCLRAGRDCVVATLGDGRMLF